MKEIKLLGAAMPSVKLADGTQAPREMFLYLLVSYGVQNGYGLRKVPGADAAAAMMSYDSLCEAMAAVSGNLDGPTYPFILPMLCRYGNADQIRTLTNRYKSWGDWHRYGQKGRTAQSVLLKSLPLSDTREAIVWLYKNSDLKQYASMRNMSVSDVYDKYLCDLGLDETGKRIIDLGATTIKLTLTKTLGISLWDTSKKKAVKSIPKEGIDPAVQKKAADELADIRQNLKEARKIKNRDLFARYIDAQSDSPERWRESYLKNPFLRKLAQLLIWEQDGRTFTLTETSLIDSSEQTFSLTGTPVKLAHPMEMKKADTEAWQRYFTKHGLKQPFLQIWEPVRQQSDIRENRYRGCWINPMYLKNQRRRGIEAEWYDKYYYGSKYVRIEGFEVNARDAQLQEDDEREFLEIASIRPVRWNRRTNMVIAFLDRITVRGRISKDDLSVMEIMDGFTLAQITEFIAAAQEAKAVNVLAALLEYKNAHFADFDPMAEFTLEW